MNEIRVKSLSSLEKCFLDEKLRAKKETDYFVMFRNERLSFQLAFELDGDSPVLRTEVKIKGKLSKYVTVSRVVNVASSWPERAADYDYLRTEPGLYPDMIAPLQYRNKAVIVRRQLHSLWIYVDLPEEIEPGVFNITGSLVEVLARNVVMNDMHSMAYMQKVLKDRGIFKELRKMGAGEGSTVIIGGTEFDFVE